MMHSETASSAASTCRYSVEVIGIGESFTRLGSALYRLRVEACGFEKCVWRRYRDFRELDNQLRARNAELPALPEEGGAWIGWFDDMVGRREQLNMLLQAMVRSDPEITSPYLRIFLAIDDEEPFQSPHLAVEDAIEDGDDEVTDAAEHSLEEFLLADEPARPSATIRQVDPRRCRLNRATTLNSRNRHSSPAAHQPPLTRWRSVSLGRCEPAAAIQNEEDSRVCNLDGDGFRDHAVVIARDIARVFVGDPRVDDVRLLVLCVLRKYARSDPELGYTQGMCFAATVVCLDAEGSATSAEERFAAVMSKLRALWVPGFPMVFDGIRILEALLDSRDPELKDHLQSLSLNLGMIVPVAWLSAFAKWLPLAELLCVVPFLGQEGIAAFVAVTFVMILHHRAALMEFGSLDEALPYLNGMCDQDPPENLLTMSQLALPAMQLIAQRMCSAQSDEGIVQEVEMQSSV